MDQELSWAHFVSKNGQTEWKRICDTPEFQVVVPQQPGRSLSKNLKTQIKEDTQTGTGKTRASVKKASSDDRGWFLYYSDTQFGPFTKDEIARFLKIGRIHGRVHAWRNEMENWDRLDNIPSFQEMLAGIESELPKAPKEPPALPPAFTPDKAKPKLKEVRRPKPELMKLEKGAKGRAAHAQAKAVELEQRKTPRAPLVAKIIMAAGEAVSVALCRDISIGGMQVLTDNLPGQVGAKIKMNVSMTGGGPGGKRIGPFTAQGVVVRILEDGKGFSFRFEKLGDSARKAIEQYIDSLE
jgi:hypothetical protein